MDEEAKICMGTRWVERTVDIGGGIGQTHKVLQQRMATMKFGPAWGTRFFDEGWSDVPTEEE